MVIQDKEFNILKEDLCKYRLLSDYANDIIMIADESGKIIEANKSALRSYGYQEEEILKKSIFELLYPDSRMPVKAQSDLDGIYYDAIARKKDGTSFFVEVSLQSVMLDRNKILLSIQRDISENRKTQIELKEAKKRAEAANQAKSEFLANMSHEIRTPLNGMLGMIDLTLMTGLTEEQKDNLFIAKDCASVLLNLINDILDFSKIEAKKLRLDNHDFDFIELIEQTIKPHSIKAKEKGLKLKCNIDKTIPRNINGDPNRIKQVINNILGNAIKFTNQGKVSLKVDLLNLEGELIDLGFQISDTGMGMDYKELKKVFETFTQADSTITRTHGGTGLGLPISKQLIEMMGGDLKVKSEKGKGTVFSFSIGLLIGEGKLHENHKKEFVKKTQKPLSILMAEDDKVNQMVVSKLLSGIGHHVEIANDGEEAIKILNKNHFDLVLMDIQMPKMDGVETVRHIRRNERETKEYIPIVALTAHALEGDRDNYLSAGMDDYLTKPIQVDELIGVIERFGDKDNIKIEKQAIEDENYNYENIKSQELLDEQYRDRKAIADILSEQINLLKDALKQKDYTLIERHSNEIKQLSSQMGIAQIRKIIFKLQLAARREDLSSATKNYNDLVDEYETFTK